VEEAASSSTSKSIEVSRAVLNDPHHHAERGNKQKSKA
jgi:hypothetical protein